MARSAAAKLFKGSAEPAVSKTLDYVDQAVMQPEIMMRNPEERLMYHTRENQRLADMGMIKPSAILPKAYVDAQQAGNIIEGDIYDAYARDRMDPSIKEEISLTKAGLPQSRLAGMTNGTKTQRVEGDNIITSQNYSTMEPEQRREYDAKFGVPTDMYGRLQKYGSTVTNIEETPEAKARRAAGAKTFNETAEIAESKYVTNDQLKRDMYSTLKSELENMGYKGTVGDTINNVMTKYAESIAGNENAKATQVEDVIKLLGDQHINFDPVKLEKLIQVQNQYYDSFVPTPVISLDGNGAKEVRLRRDVNGMNDSAIFKGKFSGGAATPAPLPVYFDYDKGDRYYEVPTNQGPQMIKADDLMNMKEVMKKNFIRTKDNPKGYELLQLGQMSGNVMPIAEGQTPTVADYKRTGNSYQNPLFGEDDKTYSSDPEYKNLKDKDDKYTQGILKRYDYDPFTNNIDVAKPAARKVLSPFSGLIKEMEQRDPAEAQAFTKMKLLESDPAIGEGGAYMRQNLTGGWDVGVTLNRLPYLQEKRVGVTSDKAHAQALDLSANSNPTILTPNGDAIKINSTVEKGKDGVMIKVHTGKYSKDSESEYTSTPGNSRAKLFDSAEKLKDDLEAKGIVPKGSTVGEGVDLPKVKVGGN